MRRLSMIPKKIERNTEKYICSKCESEYTFDDHGKYLAEKCCMCIKCGIIESDYMTAYCKKHKLEVSIENLKFSIEKDTKKLVKLQQELEKLNESDKN